MNHSDFEGAYMTGLTDICTAAYMGIRKKTFAHVRISHEIYNEIVGREFIKHMIYRIEEERLKSKR